MAGTSPAMTQRGNDIMVEIRVPTLGESVTEATIGRWFKKAGDAVAVDEPLVELETDKVTIEVPAPSAGTLGEIIAKDGETVAVGALLGQINEGGAAGDAALAGAAAGFAAAPDAPSVICPRSAPTATVSPSLALISPSTPADGAGTSIVTLSVSSSTSGSSTATLSPAFLNQRPMVASVTDSPSVGTRISVMVCFLSQLVTSS